MNSVSRTILTGLACGPSLGLTLHLLATTCTQDGVDETLRAHNFEVVDQAGRARIRLDCSDDRPAIRILGEDGSDRISISLEPVTPDGATHLPIGGPLFQVFDDEGSRALVLDYQDFTNFFQLNALNGLYVAISPGLVRGRLSGSSTTTIEARLDELGMRGHLEAGERRTEFEYSRSE